MKFVTEAATKCSGRLGTLLNSETGQKFTTPLLIQMTKGGSVPHLSKEVFDYITNDPVVLQISLSTVDQMEDALKSFGKGIAQYVGYKDSPVFINFKDTSENAPSGFNEKDIVPMFTRRGKRTITAERYMDMIETFQPNIYHTLCDSDTNEESSKKRIGKSTDRSENFFNACLDRHKKSTLLSKALLIAPIVGGYQKSARTLSIASIIKHPEVGGFMFDGLHNYGDSALTVNRNSLREIVSHCMNDLPVEKLKVMFGAYSPLSVLEMIQLGVDMFDTSYVYLASQNFRALTFNFDIKKSNDDAIYCINLNDDKYKDDFTSFLEECTCLSCQKHTKAYLHHLVKTKELLASILMMIHNIHHYLKFFDAIKDAIKHDHIQQMIDLIKMQLPENVNEKDLIVDEKPKNVIDTKSDRLRNPEQQITVECS